MRIDVVSIFPDYLAPLNLSLPGKARDKGLLEIAVHDLRDWTVDRHRTVDDSPYGGGAGMVMKPEPWGAALDAVAPDGAVLIVPTPSGTPFTQAAAQELSTREHLVFACGRYEGIDQRVFDEAADRFEVREISLGDYVLNGGEVAALAIIEAVVRLIPGFMGNADSLVEESHADGLLEYPVFTKPATWRGHEVPPVLLSGDHARIAAWRLQQAEQRTADRRPDLRHPSVLVSGQEFRLAQPADAGELLTLQRACWAQEGWLHEVPSDTTAAGPDRSEELADVAGWVASDTVLVASAGGRLVGAVRARLESGGSTPTWAIVRLLVAPDLQGEHGETLSHALLERIEDLAPPAATRCQLVTGTASARHQKIYQRAGYRSQGQPAPGLIRLTKKARSR